MNLQLKKESFLKNCANAPNKLFKSDSQHVAFLLCVGISV